MVHSYYYEKSMVNAVEYVVFVIVFFHARAYWVIGLWLLIGLLMILLTDRKYFPYFSYLTISTEYVERRVGGITIVRLSRKNMHYHQCRIGNIDFAVFSTESVTRCSQIGITYLARKKRAIIYPFTGKMKVDLAPLFQNPSKELDETMSEDQGDIC